MSIEMEPSTLLVQAGHHDEAAETVWTGLRQGPTSIDGGIVSSDCAAIISRVSGLVESLALLHGQIGVMVRAVADGTRRTDEEVAASLQVLDQALDG